ncbi:ribosomal-protein-alanine N-acetyltransferase [Pseudoruegeria aquimaris]|uniref:Ribosomal-protein-alanine N-acetyltransferase n=1 Tax=Pseudoruegeria aquimaris TaxID=393663 RepID=A0A1Y5SQL9_9RHOB|nr:GNAT family N-acetyltransferase [Pseudoruegeria aquimaris]SLN46039.1 ribosomal-protein-alanine N-acetyltransferase [Pseudoruegeria aquimaris]
MTAPQAPAAPEALAALHARAFRDTRPWTADEFAALLADPACFLAARAEGFALGRAVAGEAELLTIAVAPEARRAGHGRALLAAFEAAARAAGARTAFLEVDAENAPALGLYLSNGYGESGRRKGYYRHADGHRSDALVLSKALPAL